LKILLIGPASPLRGGIANFNDSLFLALENEHEPHIVGFSMQYPSLLFPGVSQFEEGDNQATIRSNRLINSINPLSWRKAASRILKLKPDCIVVHYWMPFFAPSLGYIIRRVKKYLNIKVIGLLHNVNPHERMPGTKWLNRYFLTSCDGYITMSSSVTDDLKKFELHKPHREIPHPVYDIFGKPVSKEYSCRYLNLDTRQNHLLFFGIIRSYKGLDLLLNALSSKSIGHLNLKLLVAGEFYENEKKYTDLAEKLGLGEKIMFTRSFVPREEVPYYFGAADLVVLPYLSATQSGIAQVAYHFEKPMLVTDVGGLSEIVPHGRVGYVCRKDAEEIAGAIADFFDNKRSAGFTANIKAEKERFSWKAMINGIEDIEKEIAAPAAEFEND
jgi:D-inositol-3-phosphate glycosyltransferase